MGIWGKRLFDLWFVNARDNKVIRLPGRRRARRHYRGIRRCVNARFPGP